ncbi:Predicted nucleotidyltransferase [Aneurinibacillus thermoaerophilus]|uniref:tRNA(Met) cytidine acetate ligase n=1 Tax=Aneurinibacillus thermoaerophilus TaxID=143495 RepID=A0A1G7WBR1_ANETH|nr:nucleotidyltransferase [Aneurinibacillus thermoaerophilus]SDG69415.1 Predicted nucleotidyltransferase [Aneurinibacillus thermoaerophilus]
MKTVGIVVEYNPLHNGHAYHFVEAKKRTGADAIVAVMSGHFLQRGEPAIVNKWARANMALRLGVDLVLELPFVYATQNAERFAFGSIATLHATGVVDAVCFGSESGEISWMKELAARLAEEPSAFQTALKQELSQGKSYPAAYGRAIKMLLPDTEEAENTRHAAEPNNILGLNYCLALHRLQSPMKAVTIKRQKAGYHQTDITDKNIASATALRRMIFERENVGLDVLLPYVPAGTLEVLKQEKAAGRFPMSWERFFPYLQHQLLTRWPEELATIHEMNEGIERRLLQVLPGTDSFFELMNALKTRRYTWNRLQRLLLYSMLNLTREKMARAECAPGPTYIRVLGFNEIGRKLLKKMKEVSALPVITRVPKNRHPMLSLDVQAGAIYALGYPQCIRKKEMQREFWQPPLQYENHV